MSVYRYCDLYYFFRSSSQSIFSKLQLEVYLQAIECDARIKNTYDVVLFKKWKMFIECEVKIKVPLVQ
jgi:hypothetical protein